MRAVNKVGTCSTLKVLPKSVVIDSLLPFISFTQTQWDVSTSDYKMGFLIT